METIANCSLCGLLSIFARRAVMAVLDFAFLWIALMKQLVLEYLQFFYSNARNVQTILMYQFSFLQSSLI